MPENDKTASKDTPPGPVTAQQRCPCRRIITRLYARIRGALAFAMVLLIVLICTPISEKLYCWLDVTEPLTQADMIVCLGGGSGRLIWAVNAYRSGYAPRIIVTNMPSAANWMKKKLIQCGIPPEHILVDPTSAVTADHPHGIARLPGVDPKTQKFIIVTDYEHSRRAAACFRRAGFRHITMYGAGFRLRTDIPYIQMCKWRIMNLPTLLYELTGLGQYWLMGRI